MKFLSKHHTMHRDELPSRYERFRCDLCGEEFYMGPTEFFVKSPSIHYKYEDVECVGHIQLIEGTSSMKEHRRKAAATKQAIKYIFTDTNNDRAKMRERREEVNKNNKGDLVGGKI